MACVELVNNAVDQDIRMFCINDEVDTADEEYWEDRLYDAARHHARSNKFTSRRIKRAHEELWDQGAAIGMLKPGYRRNPITRPRAASRRAVPTSMSWILIKLGSWRNSISESRP